MIETVHRFGRNSSLVGILTPAVDSGTPRPGRPAVLLLNSGLIHRVGPGRLYVRLARELAAQNYDCFRFDFSGIGDSAPRVDATPVEESAVEETRAAMDFLGEARNHRRFVLLGLCGGGYFAFRTACVDERVLGLVLMNVRGHLHRPEHESVLFERAMALHFQRIATSRSYRWKNLPKILRGQFDVRGVLRSLSDWAVRPGHKSAGSEIPGAETGIDLDRLQQKSVSILSVYSEGDWSFDYLRVALGENFASRLSGERSRFELVRGTNHLFTTVWSQDHVVRLIADWHASADWTNAATQSDTAVA